ncbi:DNA-binding FadR family transcriptional regulator [Sphingomonas insulae]|nr:FadR/GntR family transcriptional regulator [Sphingomonas insulae]NIJ29646.1 DNA-binding FadR family transcriptional regulator [Sphingomonas insulae]
MSGQCKTKASRGKAWSKLRLASRCHLHDKRRMAGTHRKLYQQVAEALAARIANGSHAIGDRLPGERDLAEQFKVSRPTIREAMIALEMRGIVEARHKSGIYVMQAPAANRQFGDLDVGAFELVEARLAIEGEAAALAATAIDTDTLAQLTGLLATMAHETEQREKVDVDRTFHLLIAGATGNSVIRSMVETLWDLRESSPLCVHMFAAARRNGVAPRVDEHRAIVAALAAHDSKAARAAMRAHLSRVVDDLLEATRLELIQRAEADADAQRVQVNMRAWA